jgi:protein phosphatase
MKPARFALATDPGLVRDHNEDAAAAHPELGLYLVADGMGGHLGGEIASRIASRTVVEVVGAAKRPRKVRAEMALLGEAIVRAHAAVAQQAAERSLHGMGTTLTVLRVRGRTATIAHVGDSRAWLVHGGQILQLTQDHTLVALLVESGALDPKEAAGHPERHVLTQAVGPPAEIDPELTQAEIPRGARLLLSSDGLHDVVAEAELARLASLRDLDAAVAALVARARELGGPDNITAVLVAP